MFDGIPENPRLVLYKRSNVSQLLASDWKPSLLSLSAGLINNLINLFLWFVLFIHDARVTFDYIDMKGRDVYMPQGSRRCLVWMI